MIIMLEVKTDKSDTYCVVSPKMDDLDENFVLHIPVCDRLIEGSINDHMKLLITGVVIPEGVKFIGRAVFSGLIKLRNVVLPESLEMIEIEAFTGAAINDIDFKNVKKIGPMAFEGSRLKHITVRNDCEVDAMAFDNCDFLNHITFTGGGKPKLSFCISNKEYEISYNGVTERILPYGHDFEFVHLQTVTLDDFLIYEGFVRYPNGTTKEEHLILKKDTGIGFPKIIERVYDIGSLERFLESERRKK